MCESVCLWPNSDFPPPAAHRKATLNELWQKYGKGESWQWKTEILEKWGPSFIFLLKLCTDISGARQNLKWRWKMWLKSSLLTLPRNKGTVFLYIKIHQKSTYLSTENQNLPKTRKTFQSILARTVEFKFTTLGLWSSWSLNTNQPTAGSRNHKPQDLTSPNSLFQPVHIFLFSHTFFLNSFAGCIHPQWVETILLKESY